MVSPPLALYSVPNLHFKADNFTSRLSYQRQVGNLLCKGSCAVQGILPQSLINVMEFHFT
ncbi:unnamed protein product, partial [Staurois parvus]